MAEFALGLTKSAVEGTLSRVKSAIEEEAKLKVRVQNDLVFITGEFEMIQSFLNAANTVERAKNQVVRTWVRQLRDLAFDVEDCVEFVVHLDKTSAWTSCFWRVVPSCIAPELPLDVAIAEIQQLKARVVDVSNRNTRYNLISTNSDSNTNSKSVSSPKLELMPLATADSGTSPSLFHILWKVWAAAGKTSGTGNLAKLINSEGNDLQVVSQWQGSCSNGAGATGHHGASSSYIMKKTYEDLEIRQGFKIRVWVKLMHPFHPDEFLDSLLTQLYTTSSNHQPNATLPGSGHADFRIKKMKAALAKKLMQQLNEQRYFIILEDVSTVAEWDAIRMYLPDCNNGSRIVVSVSLISTLSQAQRLDEALTSHAP